MLSNGATHLPISLSLDEDHDENKDLKEFYQSNLSGFKSCPMKLITYEVIREIALKLDETKSFDEDWRKYATEMGIDNKTITEIKVSAYCHREQELFIAMDRVIRQRGTFGHIIQALLKTERFDVLKEIESFVRSILPKIPDKQISNSASMTCKDKNDVEGHCTIGKDSVFFSEQKYELDCIQQNSINSHFKNALQISNCSKNNKLEIVPSAPEEEKLTVLIQHTESENSIAEQLSVKFAEEGMIATTLTEVNNLTLYDPVLVLDTIFKEVDFIVPVVSNRFMEEIHPQNHDQYLESVYAQNNRKLYTLIMDEYRFNRYINFRVRPVIVEGMSRKLVTDAIFSFSFRLPNEIQKLIRVLKETKELRARKLIK